MAIQGFQKVQTRRPLADTRVVMFMISLIKLQRQCYKKPSLFCSASVLYDSAMSALSTTTYVPLDSYAPPTFVLIRTINYVTAVSLGLLLYDHTITLDKEVEWIWTLKWRLPKIVFIFNRYVITLLLLMEAIPGFIFPLSVSLYALHITSLFEWVTMCGMLTIYL